MVSLLINILEASLLNYPKVTYIPGVYARLKNITENLVDRFLNYIVGHA